MRYLNYPGDITADAVGQVVGPTEWGEYLTSVSAEYDSGIDMTRVGYRFTTLPEMQAWVEKGQIL
jgi:hypothetical protein